jgi:hypothetical protein
MWWSGLLRNFLHLLHIWKRARVLGLEMDILPVRDYLRPNHLPNSKLVDGSGISETAKDQILEPISCERRTSQQVYRRRQDLRKK